MARQSSWSRIIFSLSSARSSVSMHALPDFVCLYPGPHTIGPGGAGAGSSASAFVFFFFSSFFFLEGGGGADIKGGRLSDSSVPRSSVARGVGDGGVLLGTSPRYRCPTTSAQERATVGFVQGSS